ncbi:MAG TPA: septal ring lytic transglycosylase RlpA family protein [Candidatus Paceibacterota bacterium]|nr:septal ring lytic transglycosylase RlpA family protein [Candidatus Paceibacterota bacterium]
MLGESKIAMLVMMLCSLLSAGGPRRSNQVYIPGKQTDFYLYEKGEASWYGPGFHGKTTAGGKTFNTYHFMVAHKTLPIGEVICVRNPANNRVIVCEVADRGPFVRGRIIDLSYTAMNRLGLVSSGHGMIEIYRTADARVRQ